MKRLWWWVLVLAACTKPEMQSVETVKMPEQWTAAPPSLFGLPDGAPWWEACGDDRCIEWIRRALANSPQIEQAVGQLAELGALYVAAVGQNSPQAQLNGFAQRFMQSVNAPLQQAVNVLVNRWYNDFTMGFAAAWEFDFWGRLEAIRCAAQADFEAGVSALWLQAVTLPAEIAVAANTWRFAARRSDLLDRRIAVLARRLELNRGLERAGLLDSGTALLVEQAYDQLKGQKPLLQQTIQEAIRRIAVLTGEYPERIIAEGIDKDQVFVEPRFPALVPSQLLLQRPDVKTAYYQLAAAESRVAQAVAQRYPIFSLAATIGLDSGAIGNFLQARSAFASIGPQILQTVLDGGNLAQQAEAAAARQAQALAIFKGAVLTAFEEVENALNGGYLLRASLQQLQRAQMDADQKRSLSQDLLLRGLISEGDYLDAEENWIVVTDSVLSAQASVQNQWISLARATSTEPDRELVAHSKPMPVRQTHP
jgi:NodT family efflux transporter outer membrane factor (OMF) lipoprotein